LGLRAKRRGGRDRDHHHRVAPDGPLVIGPLVIGPLVIVHYRAAADRLNGCCSLSTPAGADCSGFGYATAES
jgi:hypothetical protein